MHFLAVDVNDAGDQLVLATCVLFIIIAGFLALMFQRLGLVKRDAGAAKETIGHVNEAVNNVGPSDPKLRDLVVEHGMLLKQVQVKQEDRDIADAARDQHIAEIAQLVRGAVDRLDAMDTRVATGELAFAEHLAFLKGAEAAKRGEV